MWGSLSKEGTNSRSQCMNYISNNMPIQSNLNAYSKKLKVRRIDLCWRKHGICPWEKALMFKNNYTKSQIIKGSLLRNTLDIGTLSSRFLPNFMPPSPAGSPEWKGSYSSVHWLILGLLQLLDLPNPVPCVRGNPEHGQNTWVRGGSVLVFY